MRYDKNYITSVAHRLQSKSKNLEPIQRELSHITPEHCSSRYYTNRYHLLNRLGNVQSELNSLAFDINHAANQMSSDDVGNARYIREVFTNRVSKITYGSGNFQTGDLHLQRSGTMGSCLLASTTEINLTPVKSLGNAPKGKKPWYQAAGKWITTKTESLGNKIYEFGAETWNHTSDFISGAKKWVGDRWDDAKEAASPSIDYIWRSVKHFVLGDYGDEDITVLSFLGSIAAGFFDVDLPMDARDLAYDVQHRKEIDHPFFMIGIDILSVFPIVGVVKGVKYLDDVAAGTKNLGKVTETVIDTNKAVDKVSDTIDTTIDIGKKVDDTSEAVKNAQNASDAVDTTTDIGKKADDVSEAAADLQKRVSSIGDGVKVDDALRAADNAHFDPPNRFQTHIIENHGPNSTKPNKGKFNSSADIQALIDDTLHNSCDKITLNSHGRGGFRFEKRFSSPIGVDIHGEPTSTIRIVVDENGNILTAFPLPESEL